MLMARTATQIIEMTLDNCSLNFCWVRVLMMLIIKAEEELHILNPTIFKILAQTV